MRAMRHGALPGQVETLEQTEPPSAEPHCERLTFSSAVCVPARWCWVVLVAESPFEPGPAGVLRGFRMFLASDAATPPCPLGCSLVSEGHYARRQVPSTGVFLPWVLPGILMSWIFAG